MLISKSIYQIDVVMHFAAHIDVAESVRDPFKYYRNNVVATQVLLQHSCFIFWFAEMMLLETS